MALTSIYYDGTVTETDRAQNMAGAPLYGVYGPDDFKVTSHPTLANAVIVKAGKAHGHGVTDIAAEDQVVNCAPLSVGQSRWDMIVIRRNWQPALGGPSTLEVVQAGGTPTIPSTRKVGPGVEDDQPLFFVKWQGGTSAPVDFVDARVWTGNGGLYAKNDVVRSYLTAVGTEININGVKWAYQLGTNDLPEWATTPSVTVKSLAASEGNWSYAVRATLTTDGTNKQVTVGVTIVRTGGGNFTFGPNAYTPIFSDLIPAGWRPATDYVASMTMTGPSFGQCAAYFTPGGGFQLRSFGPTYAIAPGLGITGVASWAVA